MGVDEIADRSPGEDPEDPYADVDVAELPRWWRNAVDLFRESGLRPFRPARFSDGVLVHPLVRSVERTLEIPLRIYEASIDDTEDWRIEIDGRETVEVRYHRHTKGYGVFDVPSTALLQRVKQSCQLDGCELELDDVNGLPRLVMTRAGR